MTAVPHGKLTQLPKPAVTHQTQQLFGAATHLLVPLTVKWVVGVRQSVLRDRQKAQSATSDYSGFV